MTDIITTPNLLTATRLAKANPEKHGEKHHRIGCARPEAAVFTDAKYAARFLAAYDAAALAKKRAEWDRLGNGRMTNG